MSTIALVWLIIRCVFVALIGWCLAVCAERMFSGAGKLLKPVYTEKADGTLVKENRELDFQMGTEGWIRAGVIAGTLGLIKFLNGILRWRLTGS